MVQEQTAFLTSDKVMPLLMQFVASVVLLMSACISFHCGENTTSGISYTVDCTMIKNWTYTIIAASVALCSSLTAMLLIKFARPTYDKVLAESTPAGDLSIGYILALCNFVWWGAAAGIITFQGPFTSTGNGYFAVWAGFLCSVSGIGASVTKAWSAAANSSALLGLLVASIVVFCALLATESIGHAKPYQGEAIFSLVISMITAITIMILLIMEAAEYEEGATKFKLPILIFFGVLWIVLACCVTFSGPFTSTSNGYFGSWAGAALCLRAAFPSTAEALAIEQRQRPAVPAVPQAQPVPVAGGDAV